jgi:hypothetical protein
VRRKQESVLSNAFSAAIDSSTTSCCIVCQCLVQQHMPNGVVGMELLCERRVVGVFFAVSAGDFDGDGYLDLVTANRRPSDPPVDGGASVLLGRGDGLTRKAPLVESCASQA